MAKVSDLESVLGKYRTIYLDPPWPYDRRPLGRRSLEEIYAGGVMSIGELKQLPLRELGHADGHFFVWLWCTWPKMRDGLHLEVLDAWDLKWVSEIIWNKVKIGMGRRVRKQTEPLLLAILKDGPPGRVLARNDQRDLVTSPSTRKKHSAKPVEFRQIIETLTPGPRIELFARSHPPQWDVWGHEAPEEVTSED